MAPNQDTQIIGYAEPWIVSPGDPVDIKVGSQFSNLGRLFPRLFHSKVTPMVRRDVPRIGGVSWYLGTFQTLTRFRFRVPKKDTITV